MNITREEAWELIYKQMESEGNVLKANKCHYGRVELKELLNAIYGEDTKPNADDSREVV